MRLFYRLSGIKILLLVQTHLNDTGVCFLTPVSGGTPRRHTVTVQSRAEPFSQQFVRPQQLLDGKVALEFSILQL